MFNPLPMFVLCLAASGSGFSYGVEGSNVDEFASNSYHGSPPAASWRNPSHTADALAEYPLVPVLGSSVSPAAVVRTIPLVVINPVDAMFVAGALPHVSKELGWGINPIIADGDTSAAVIGEGMVGFVIASRHHVPPTVEFWRTSESVSHPPTPARLSKPSIKVSSESLGGNPTVAKAVPFVRTGLFGVAGDDEHSVSVANDVYGSCGYTIQSHVISPSNDIDRGLDVVASSTPTLTQNILTHRSCG